MFDFLRAANAAHEREMKRRNFADGAVLRQRGERGAWKNNFGILFGYPADSGVVIDNNRASGDQPECADSSSLRAAQRAPDLAAAGLRWTKEQLLIG